MSRANWGRKTLALPLVAAVAVGAGAGVAAGTRGASAGRAVILRIAEGQPWEFGLRATRPVVPAGRVTFRVTNHGKLVHELIVLRTPIRAASLGPMNRDGQIDESASRGEVADIEPGTTRSVTLRLPPGHYVLICNEPGHYLAGMHRDLVVR